MSRTAAQASFVSGRLSRALTVFVYSQDGDPLEEGMGAHSSVLAWTVHGQRAGRATV